MLFFSLSVLTGCWNYCIGVVSTLHYQWSSSWTTGTRQRGRSLYVFLNWPDDDTGVLSTVITIFFDLWDSESDPTHQPMYLMSINLNHPLSFQLSPTLSALLSLSLSLSLSFYPSLLPPSPLSFFNSLLCVPCLVSFADCESVGTVAPDKASLTHRLCLPHGAAALAQTNTGTLSP